LGKYSWGEGLRKRFIFFIVGGNGEGSAAFSGEGKENPTTAKLRSHAQKGKKENGGVLAKVKGEGVTGQIKKKKRVVPPAKKKKGENVLMPSRKGTRGLFSSIIGR